MLDVLDQRMSELADEAEELVNKRAELHDTIEKINVRLAHVVGALQELDTLKRRIEDGSQENKNSTENT
jgi:prefoldin subunit 5